MEQKLRTVLHHRWVPGTLILLGMGDLLLLALTGHGIPCLFHLLTGYLCPGCGMTHALLSLCQGNVAQALSENALCLSVFPVLCGYLVYRLITGERDEDTFHGWEIALLLVLLIVTLGYGVLRNLGGREEEGLLFQVLFHGRWRHFAASDHHFLNVFL